MTNCLRIFFICLSITSSMNSQNSADFPNKSLSQFLDLYEQFEIVMIGERHGSKEIYDYLYHLLAESQAQKVIDDIVVEFGNSSYQNYLDRYIMGDSVSSDSLELIWKDHTMLFTWDSPVYRDFFQFIRRLNSNNPKSPYRVLLGDPPIDWTKVLAAEDYALSVRQRDIYPFKLLKEEVFTKDRKALVIYGGAHIIPLNLQTMTSDSDSTKATLAQHLKSEYLEDVFCLWTFTSDDEQWKGLNIEETYSFKKSSDPKIGSLSFRTIYGEDIYASSFKNGVKEWKPLDIDQWVTIQEAVDGILYLGSQENFIPAELDAYEDREYLTELNRRAKIVDSFFGFDFNAKQLDRLRTK